MRSGYSDEIPRYLFLLFVRDGYRTRSFDEDTTVTIAIKHLQEKWISSSVYTENLPYSLEQIILNAHRKRRIIVTKKMEDVIADLKHSLIDPQGNFSKEAER